MTMVADISAPVRRPIAAMEMAAGMGVGIEASRSSVSRRISLV